ncbi:unnamed protein product [Merluccius merluccius]
MVLKLFAIFPKRWSSRSNASLGMSGGTTETVGVSHPVSHGQENRLYRDRRIGLNPHSVSDRRLRGRHPRRELRLPAVKHGSPSPKHR